MKSDSLANAKYLRKNQTDAERKIWRNIRNRQLGDFKFKRQYPMGPYILDFVCIDRKLVVEIDGGQHMERREKDRKRTQYLESRGYRVIRFWNDQALKETPAVLESILECLNKE